MKKSILYGMAFGTFVMIVVFGALFLSMPSIEDETDMVKYEQFDVVDGTNDDLEDLANIRNIHKYGTEYYFGKISGTTITANSVTGLTGSTTVEDTTTAFSAPAGVNDVVTRGWDNDIYVGFMDTNTNIAQTGILRSLDGGSTWADYQTATSGVANTNGNVNIIDMFKSGANIYIVWVIEDFGAGSFTCGITQDLGATDLMTDTPSALDTVYAGYLDSNSDYNFIIYDGSNFKLVVYDVSAGTDSSSTITGLTVPSSWDANNQQYWKVGITEIVMDKDNFKVNINSGGWAPFSDTGTTTNAIVWTQDANDNYIINYIVWKDTIYKMIGAGYPVAIEQTTDDAYVGWDDWYSNGADTIYQVGYDDFPATVCRLGNSLYGGRSAEITTMITPFARQTLILWNNAGTELLGIFRILNSFKRTTNTYQLECYDPATRDYQEQIIESFTTTDAPDILTTALDNCVILYDGGNISTTPAETYTMDWDSKLNYIRNFCDMMGGDQSDPHTQYVSYVKPTFEVVYSTWDDSSIAITDADGIADIDPFKNREEYLNYIRILGKPVNGVITPSIVQGDPNIGFQEYRFSNLSSTITDLLAAQIETDRNQAIKTLHLKILGQNAQFQAGQYITLTYTKYSITTESWYIVSNVYDALGKINYAELKSVKYLPILQNANVNVQQQIAQLDQSYATFLGLGSANAIWWPCSFELESEPGKVDTTGIRISNVDGTDVVLLFHPDVALERGGLTFHLTGWRVDLNDADASNYIDQIRMRYAFISGGATSTGTITGSDDTTNYTSVQTITNTFTAVDCVNYAKIGVQIFLVVATGFNVDISRVEVYGYYA